MADFRAKPGGCLCGAVRYEIASDPVTFYACHCTDCQTVSGASFTLTMIVSADSISIRQGAPERFPRPRADGRVKEIIRCPICLTALWGVRPDVPNAASVYAGTLDDSSSLEPVGHIWTGSAQAWLSLPEGELNFVGQPRDILTLIRAWKSRTP